ncbi:MAG: SWF/SNF helicase family protein [Bacteroidales bacterium]|nr:SWF/SNF helicase family protein [Bacteroidales bacterium]
MRLRQIANHPKICNIEDSQSVNESGKFDEVVDMLNAIIQDKSHKILLFSSFVSQLELYANYLDENSIKYSLLTGESTNRESLVTEFQENTENQIFLISIKAGGVGLNLTAADYVFLLDPWWNPAVENQAISRAHRIGQTNKVFVYRFITENSIEEKIRSLQEKKKELADTFIQNENSMVFSLESVNYLFD